MGRPKKVIKEPLDVDTDNTVPEDTITLEVVEPTDVVLPKKETITDKAKKFLGIGADSTSDTEEEVQPKKRGRKPKTEQNTFSFVNYATMLSLGAISIMSGMIDEKYTSIVPTIEQSNAIITPLLRIIDRHTKITEVHPDVTDMLMFFAALTAYAFEARATYILLKEKEVESDNDKRKNTTNLSDYVSTDNND